MAHFSSLRGAQRRGNPAAEAAHTLDRRASLAMTGIGARVGGDKSSQWRTSRHCEERSDVAIQSLRTRNTTIKSCKKRY
jgi:hypothetical protein